VRAGSAEQCHGRVANVLVNHSAVSIDGRVDDAEETLEQSMDLFGVQLRREPRVTNNIAEHHSDRPPVSFAAGVDIGDSGVALTKRPTAAAAEAIRGVVGVTAFFA